MFLSCLRTLSALASAALLFVAWPLRAQDGGLYDQFASAQTVFGQEGGLALFSSSERVFNGLDGVWFPIGSYTLEVDERAAVATACEVARAQIRTLSPWSFELVRMGNITPSMTTVFTQRQGMLYASHTDPSQMAAQMNMDIVKDVDYRAMILGSLNREYLVLRPSADILVFIADGTPEYYGRCPT